MRREAFETFLVTAYRGPHTGRPLADRSAQSYCSNLSKIEETLGLNCDNTDLSAAGLDALGRRFRAAARSDKIPEARVSDCLSALQAYSQFVTSRQSGRRIEAPSSESPASLQIQAPKSNGPLTSVPPSEPRAAASEESELPDFPSRISAIFGNASSNLEGIKQQQWSITNYTAAIIGGLFVSVRLFPETLVTKALFAVIISAAAVIGIVMLRHSTARRQRHRDRLAWITRRYFTETERREMELDRGDQGGHDPYFDFSFYAVVAVLASGAIVATILPPRREPAQPPPQIVLVPMPMPASQVTTTSVPPRPNVVNDLGQ